MNEHAQDYRWNFAAAEALSAFGTRWNADGVTQRRPHATFRI
jgi:hypothetical protein